MKRLLAVAAACLLVAGCLNRNAPQGGIPQPAWSQIADTVNAKPARAQVAQRVRWQNHPNMFTNTGRPVWAWVDGSVIHIDVDCGRWPCWQVSGDPPWWLWHEIGHALLGPGEARANCVAEAIVGREVRGFAYTAAYPNCSHANVLLTIAELRRKGVSV